MAQIRNGNKTSICGSVIDITDWTLREKGEQDDESITELSELLTVKKYTIALHFDHNKYSS